MGGPFCAGLIDILKLFSVAYEGLKNAIKPILYDLIRLREPTFRAEFQLVAPPLQVDNHREPWRILELPNMDEAARTAAINEIQACADQLRHDLQGVAVEPYKWVWVESYEDTVWLWDAGMEPVSAESIFKDPVEETLSRYLRMVIYWSEGRIHSIITGPTRAYWER